MKQHEKSVFRRGFVHRRRKTPTETQCSTRTAHAWVRHLMQGSRWFAQAGVRVCAHGEHASIALRSALGGMRCNERWRSGLACVLRNVHWHRLQGRCTACALKARNRHRCRADAGCAWRDAVLVAAGESLPLASPADCAAASQRSMLPRACCAASRWQPTSCGRARSPPRSLWQSTLRNRLPGRSRWPLAWCRWARSLGGGAAPVLRPIR